MSKQIEVAAKTDVGIERENNEDNFGYDTRLGVFVLCDGMGGQASGEVASRLAVASVLNYFRVVEPTHSDTNALQTAIHQANKAIREAAAHNPAQGGMGSTIVAALIHGESIKVGHVGDSRIYLFRKGNLQQLTMDHSLVMEQVRRGYLTVEEAEHSDLQNIILRALGAAENVEPDFQDLIAFDQDILMLACDGLTKAVPVGQIKSILSAEENLDAAVSKLIAAAKENKSDDNITCMLIRLSQCPWYRRFIGQEHSSQGPF